MKHIIADSQHRTQASYWTRVLLLCTSLCLLFPAVGPATALADTGEKATDIGLGLASFVTTVPYGAVKVAYAGLGAIIGGFTYLLTAGDIDSANVIWEKSLLGHYVITPDHLTGNTPVKFVGP
ncbi:MAG: hypothetical protein NPIRA02_06330 [Nitrospirales bacterium]|nr:MAG: hypothetical protein NPIRA02_06330 [Nitrospirales bacterium]